MEESQLSTLFQSIAVSSGSLAPTSPDDLRMAFRVLEEFKAFDGRISVCLKWLHQERHLLPATQTDITISVKLYASTVLEKFLWKGYQQLTQPQDRLTLREAVLVASRQIAGLSISNSDYRVLANKLASLLAALMVRDFPQRWTTFVQDLMAPMQQGGLWFSKPGEGLHILGVKICLECFRLATEDTTDSDFNARISTSRRGDILMGLNEVSSHFLPPIFSLLEHYAFVLQTKSTLHNMRQYLLSQGRRLSQMTPEESNMYNMEKTKRDNAVTILKDCLLLLSRFCHTMPLDWILGEKSNSSNGSAAATATVATAGPDFVAAFLHLFREPMVQVEAVACLEHLGQRKLDPRQWMQLIRQVPPAVQEANHYWQQREQEERQVKHQVGESGVIIAPTDSLAEQSGYHRVLSKMLACMISTNIAHITTEKQITNGDGEKFDSLSKFLRLLVDMTHHPSGRICGEQINTWISLLRDPQITKTNLMRPYAEELMTNYMNHMVRIRWEDVEEGNHPQSRLIESSWDDHDEYDVWLCDIRSKSSTLFRFLGNSEPQIAASVFSARAQTLLSQFGNGGSRDHLDPKNQQLTQKSDACMQFEAFYHPLDNILVGMPLWALQEDGSGLHQRGEIRNAVREKLLKLAQALVSWSPAYLWLKFRRAQLLDSLKHYWKYEPSTLLQGIVSLLGYLSAPDDWNPGGTELSGEAISLRKKSGVALISIAKLVPEHLVPWLSELSEETKRLLSIETLLPPNRMHLYEFLSCVATAVQDPVVRANFVSDVLSNSIAVLESAEVQQNTSSVEALLTSLGITEAATNPPSVTNPENVETKTKIFVRFFSAINQLLSVGKRCNEAAKKRNGGIPLQHLHNASTNGTQSFPDEGPVSLQDLAVNDPFVPLWPRILSILLQVIDVTMRVWHPSTQAVLLQNNIQRYALAISDDEAYLSKVQDSKSGGVFGEGGTAGSIVSGTDRRDKNLVPKWSGWFNELRNTCLQLLGLLSAQRALYAHELASIYPRFVAVVANPEHLRAMENRHFTQYLKQFIEIMILSCPSMLYSSHLGPVIGPVLEHVRHRLEKNWEPVLDASKVSLTKPLYSADCGSVAALASTGDDEKWYSGYYGRAGMFVGDLDNVTAEAAVEKSRVELSRTYSDVVQAALALKGDWALVIANQAKEEQALKRNDPSKLSSGPRNRINEGVLVNADGTPKKKNQAAIDARKLLRINSVASFLLLGDEKIAGSFTLSVAQCLNYPDAYTVRRCTRICHRILETVAWSDRYTPLITNRILVPALKNIVTEPKWMVGVEWDMINLIRDVYCRLVLGQSLLPGGQGPGIQQARAAKHSSQFEQTKTADRPLQGGSILVTPSNLPRNLLANLPGVGGAAAVEELERKMNTKRSAKDQKDVLRDLLRVAAENSHHLNSGKDGVFGRAVAEESLLNQKAGNTVAVHDIPEKLVTHSMVKKNEQSRLDQPVGSLHLNLFDR